MAHGISDPDCRKEYFDSREELNAHLDQLAQWIKESQHFIVFTGTLLDLIEKTFLNSLFL